MVRRNFISNAQKRIFQPGKYRKEKRKRRREAINGTGNDGRTVQNDPHYNPSGPTPATE